MVRTVSHDHEPFHPGPVPNTVRSADGKVLTAPERWVLLPPVMDASGFRVCTEHAY
jgi:hypothetical protein